MERILFMFEKFLICQKIALVNCFGLDIANIIFKYLPNNNVNLPLINNFYVKVTLPIDSAYYMQNFNGVPNDLSLIKLHGILSRSNSDFSRFTILYLDYK
jgi:hypothetical protein